MASENLIARFEAKLDALAAAQSAEVARLASKLDKLAAAQAAQLEAVRTELQEQIKSVRWVLGGLAVALTLIFAAGEFGFAYRQAAGSPQAAPATEQSPAEGTSPSGPP